MVDPLSPKVAALAAENVYEVRPYSRNDDVVDILKRAFAPAVAAEFADAGSVLLGGVSGIGGLSASTGFGVFSPGKSKRAGQTLLAIRGTATAFDGATDATTTIRPGVGRTGVHCGFADTYDSMRPAILAYLRDRRPTFVHIVGHSLGGALATLAADEIAGANIPVKLYTFGSPRVGLARFARRVDKAVGVANIYRCYHAADPVTMLPIFPFCHVSLAAGGYRLASPGDIVAFSAHGIGGYQTDLRDRSWDEIGRVRNPFGSLVAAQAWLERAAEGAIAFPMMSSTTINLAAQALNLILQAAATIGIVSAFVAETAIDWLAQMLVRIVSASIELGRMVRHFIMVCLRLIGAGVEIVGDGTQLAARLVRWVLETLFNAIAIRAARALRHLRA